MKPVPTWDLDYYGVTFDHRVPTGDVDPMILQINILEMEDDNGAYANAGLLIPVDPADYAGVKILAVPRCCQKRKGTTDRMRINYAVENRDFPAAGTYWAERVEELAKRREKRSAKPAV